MTDPALTPDQQERADAMAATLDPRIEKLVHDQLQITADDTKATSWCRVIVARTMAQAKKGASDDEIKALAQKNYEAKSVEDHGKLSKFHPEFEPAEPSAA